MESATRLLSSDLELKLLGPPLPGAPPHLIHCTFDQLPESAKQKVREFIADHPEIPLPSPTPNSAEEKKNDRSIDPVDSSVLRDEAVESQDKLQDHVVIPNQTVNDWKGYAETITNVDPDTELNGEEWLLKFSELHQFHTRQGMDDKLVFERGFPFPGALTVHMYDSNDTYEFPARVRLVFPSESSMPLGFKFEEMNNPTNSRYSRDYRRFRVDLTNRAVKVWIVGPEGAPAKAFNFSVDNNGTPEYDVNHDFDATLPAGPMETFFTSPKGQAKISYFTWTPSNDPQHANFLRAWNPSYWMREIHKSRHDEVSIARNWLFGYGGKLWDHFKAELAASTWSTTPAEAYQIAGKPGIVYITFQRPDGFRATQGSILDMESDIPPFHLPPENKFIRVGTSAWSLLTVYTDSAEIRAIILGTPRREPNGPIFPDKIEWIRVRRSVTQGEHNKALKSRVHTYLRLIPIGVAKTECQGLKNADLVNEPHAINFKPIVLPGNYPMPAASTIPELANFDLTNLPNQKRQLNSQQLMVANALKHNVNRTIIVWGPPGTGKTYTIAQIGAQLALKRDGDRRFKVLMVAHSNSCCDVLIKKVLSIIHDEKQEASVVRFVASSRNAAHRLVSTVHSESSLLDSTLSEFNLENIRMRIARSRNDEDAIKFINLHDELTNDGWLTEVDQKAYNHFSENYDKAIIRDSDIVVCTTSLASNQLLISHGKFAAVFVDEAGACRRDQYFNSLYGHKDLLINMSGGDSQQLQPMPSPAASAAVTQELCVSQHQRFEQADETTVTRIMLREEYRMEAALMEFSNEKYYGNQLFLSQQVINGRHNGKILGDLMTANPVHYQSADPNNPDQVVLQIINNNDLLLNVTNGFSIEDSQKSSVNMAEVLLCVDLAMSFLRSGVKETDLMILASYTAQVYAIQNQLRRIEPQCKVRVMTVDGAQGDEAHIVILSMARSVTQHGRPQEAGFVTDYRRLNVCLTRARYCRYVVCDAEFFQKCAPTSDITAFIDFMKTRDKVRDVIVPYAPPAPVRQFPPDEPQTTAAPDAGLNEVPTPAPAPAPAPAPVDPVDNIDTTAAFASQRSIMQYFGANDFNDE